MFADASWHYGCLRDLQSRQLEDRSSLGVVKVARITNIDLVKRSKRERQEHESKLSVLRSQIEMFSTPLKALMFQPYRFRIDWICDCGANQPPCEGHSAMVLDWGIHELARKSGPEKAIQKLEELGNVDRYDLRFFMGNYFRRQHLFGIVGLWYPLKRDLRQENLFAPSGI